MLFVSLYVKVETVTCEFLFGKGHCYLILMIDIEIYDSVVHIEGVHKSINLSGLTARAYRDFLVIF